MQIKGAITVLRKRCKFFGMTMDELVNFVEVSPLAQDNKTTEAMKVYKIHLGSKTGNVVMGPW